MARAGRDRYLAGMSEADPILTPPPRQRKPDWIRVKAPTSAGFAETKRLMRSLNLATVCEEAACPNIGECWTKKHATVMILGDTCTRACAFCNVKTGMPRAVDPLEPEHVATAAAELGLSHIVVTSVDRDDLPDGGAKQFVRVIEALRRNTPSTTIEILTPDFRNKPESAIEAIVAARPDVYNHNLETVPRLYPTIRPGARYYASLRLLESVKRQDPAIFTKSGLMVGLGEQRLEVHQVMDDMRSADVDFLTMGQYLQPTPRHAKVEEFVTPAAFSAYGAIARAKGFLLVAASPLTRSSYHAGDDFAKMKAAREAKHSALAMPRHTETRRMLYTPEQMFDLVADVKRYHEFLPWIAAVRVRSDSETLLIADLVVGFRAIKETFTSRVEKRGPERIRTEYIEGPLKYLQNSWVFRPDGEGGTEIDFCVDFAFKNRLFESLAGQMFDRALRRMIGAFEDRARELYGPGAEQSAA